MRPAAEAHFVRQFAVDNLHSRGAALPIPASSTSLYRDALAGFRDEASRLTALWRDLDSKAQGVVAIGGIFIAATFAYVRDVPASFSLLARFALAVALALLVAAVICAILAARVRQVVSGVSGKSLFQMTSETIQAASRDGDMDARELNLLRDQCRLWQATTDSLTTRCGKKADLVLSAQVLVGLAAAIVALLVVIRISTSS